MRRRSSAGVGDFGISFGALLLTYFSLMGIQSGKESWLACDEKHNDIWLKAMARQLPLPFGVFSIVFERCRRFERAAH